MEKNIKEIAKEIAEIIYSSRTERGLKEMVFEVYKSGGIYWTYGFRYPQHTPRGEETWFYVHHKFAEESLSSYRIDTGFSDAIEEDYEEWLKEAQNITADRIVEMYNEYLERDLEPPYVFTIEI